MAITKVTNRVLDDSSVGVTQLSAGAVPTKLTSEIGALNFRNKIINGDMRIDQRNAGIAVAAVNGTRRYSVDRMAIDVVGAGNVTCQQVTDAPPGFQYSSRLTVVTPNTNRQNDDRTYFMHVIEGSNIASIGFNRSWCKTLTLSFWVKASITGIYSATLFYDILGGGVARRRYVASFTINTANTWEFKTLTIPADPNSGIDPDITNGVGLILTFILGSSSYYRTATPGVWYTTSGTFPFNGPWGDPNNVQWIGTAGATFQITGLQLEEGPIVTPFEQRPIGLELSLCQRYYELVRAGLEGYAAGFMSYYIPFVVQKRITPQLAILSEEAGSGVASTSVESESIYGFWYKILKSGAAGQMWRRSNVSASAEF